MSRKRRGRERQKLEIEEEREWKGIARLVAAKNLRTIETRPRHERYRYNKCQVGNDGKKKRKKKKTVRAPIRQPNRKQLKSIVGEIWNGDKLLRSLGCDVFTVDIN